MLLRLALVGVLLASVAFASPTIIDILSSSAQYSILLSHIRHHGLVPLINTSRNATLVAPVNSAFASIDPDDVTRELLLYHLADGEVLSNRLQHGDTIMDSYLPDGNNGKVPVVASNLKERLLFNSVPVVEKDIKAGVYRGVVQAVDQVLTVPKSTCDTLKDVSSDKFLALLQKDGKCEDVLQQGKTTVLLPADEAFDRFSDVEMKYFDHDEAHGDRKRVVNRHIVPGVIPQRLNTSIKSLDGQLLNFSNGSINSTFAPVSTNIVTKTGIIHVYDTLLSEPHKLVEYTPEKYLYGLGSGQFVRELKFLGAEYLVNGSTTSPQTIFVPMNTVEGEALHLESVNSLIYRFVEGQYHLSEHLDEEFLMTSKMATTKLNKERQRIKIVTSASGAVYVNGHPMVSEEYVVGDTSIYFIDGDLDVPPSLSLAVGPFFQNSYSIDFLRRLHLLYPPKHQPWTVLMPTRDAWQEQGLVRKYFDHNMTQAEKFFESMIFQGSFYTDSEPRSATFLDGSQKQVSCIRSPHTNDPKSKCTRISVDGAQLQLNAPDVLFDAGVAHSVDTLSLPSTVHFGARDLINAGERNEFIELLEARNLSHVLDASQNFTVLVPSISSLRRHNITQATENIDLLLAMHILPNNPIDELLGEAHVQTLAKDVSLKARDVSDGLYIIQVVGGGADHELHIRTRGDTSTGNGTRTTVLFIDRHLRPEWISNPFDHDSPVDRLKTSMAILLGVVGGAVLIFCIISCTLYLYLWRNQRKYGEQEPLLGDEDGNGNGDYDHGDEHDDEDGNVQYAGYASTDSRTPRRHMSRQSSQYAQENIPNDQQLQIPTISSDTADTVHGESIPIRTSRVSPDREFGRHLDLPNV